MELGDEHKPGWQQVVEIDTKPVQIKEEPEKAVLDDEPVLNEGLAAALELADIKGDFVCFCHLKLKIIYKYVLNMKYDI